VPWCGTWRSVDGTVLGDVTQACSYWLTRSLTKREYPLLSPCQEYLSATFFLLNDVRVSTLFPRCDSPCLFCISQGSWYYQIRPYRLNKEVNLLPYKVWYVLPYRCSAGRFLHQLCHHHTIAYNINKPGSVIQYKESYKFFQNVRAQVAHSLQQPAIMNTSLFICVH
jgi:hypothetical protein